MNSFTVKKVEAWPVDLPLKASFVVATGTMDVARNIFVRVILQDGSVGYGEVAPFPDISGEDQATCLSAFPAAAQVLLGEPATQFRHVAQQLLAVTPSFPALRCGLETALLDALCRAMGIPLWGLWGGADIQKRETDVTLPIGAPDAVVLTAREWYQQGFRILKMKVGHGVEDDIRRVEAVAAACPEASFVLDANQGYSFEQAREFLFAMKHLHIPVRVFEQPIHRDHPEEMSMLKNQSRIPLAADESLRSLEDARQLIEQKAVDIFNLKITKCGVMESVRIAELARASGVRLMIGGMVESRVAMGCSWSLVPGFGGFEILDLDMPLLLSIDPIQGGYHYEGAMLHPWYEPGLGMSINPDRASMVTIE
ncbi:MAG: dipeptide epimerase [Nitrospirales bacterium]|nr:MAG: dipeptide epimerase [Nitrospirales bacterium]